MTKKTNFTDKIFLFISIFFNKIANLTKLEQLYKLTITTKK